jgi:hypothetical protein
MHFLLKFCKKTHVQHSSGLTTSLRLLRLESRGYNKLHPSPKLTASLRLMIRSPSSFVLNLCLTFLNSACTSFTPNQMYPLGLWLSSSYIIVVSQMSTICPVGACVSLISSKYPIWYQSTFEPCLHDLTRAFGYPSCSVIQENIIFHHANNHFNLKVITQMGGCCPRHWNLRELFSILKIRSSWTKKIE